MQKARVAPKGRARRGATMVFVAVFSLVIVGVVAFTIDLSRLFTGASELQTLSDAAALRGAQELQRAPGVSPAAVTSAFSAQNEALGAKETVPEAAVTPVFWDPTAANPETPTNWANANAVAVAASRTSRLLFGRVLSPRLPTTSQRAIAWVASVARITCPAPWGFPMAALNDAIFANPTPALLDENYFAELRAKTERDGPFSVTMVVYPDGETAPVTTPNEVWPFEAIGPNQNMNDYPEQVAGGVSCGADAAAEIGETETFPGDAAVAQKTVRGAMGHQSIEKGTASLCEPSPKTSADCFPKGSGRVGTAGVDVVVSWIGPVTQKAASVLTIGGFRVMCVFGDVNGSGKTAGGQGQSCDFFTRYLSSGYAPQGLTAAKLPQGTIVGYPVTLTPNLGQGVVLNNSSSLAQRLVLVR